MFSCHDVGNRDPLTSSALEKQTLLFAFPLRSRGDRDPSKGVSKENKSEEGERIVPSLLDSRSQS